jgi:hypothetical protein
LTKPLQETIAKNLLPETKTYKNNFKLIEFRKNMAKLNPIKHGKYHRHKNCNKGMVE